MQLNKERILRSIRLAIALIICFGIARVFKIAHPLWIFITLVVVLFDQSTVGGAIFRGLLRIAATLLGAATAILVLIIFHNNQLVNEAVIILSIMIYAYLFMDSKYSYIGVLGSITMIIVLINDYNLSSELNMSAALMRVATIIIGTFVAVVSMILFFPQYAKYKIKQHIADSLNKIEQTIRIFINPANSLEKVQQQVLLLESGLTSGITKFIRLSEEMRYETKVRVDYTHTLLHLRRINRLLNVVLHNFPNPEIRHNQMLNTTLERLAEVFKALEQQIQNNTLNRLDIPLDNIEYQTPEIKSVADYELIFTYSILNRIINETRLLITELEKISDI